MFIFLFAPLPPNDWQNNLWTASAYYEGGTGENAAHTACLQRRAKDLSRRYRTAVEDYNDDLNTAASNYVTAEVEADAEYLAELSAIARAPATPPAKLVMIAAAQARKSFNIYRASNARTTAEREAKSDFDREVGNLDAEHAEDQQDCWDLYVQPILDLAEQENLLPQQQQPGSTQVALDDIQNKPAGTVTVAPVN